MCVLFTFYIYSLYYVLFWDAIRLGAASRISAIDFGVQVARPWMPVEGGLFIFSVGYRDNINLPRLHPRRRASQDLIILLLTCWITRFNQSNHLQIIGGPGTRHVLASHETFHTTA